MIFCCTQWEQSSFSSETITALFKTRFRLDFPFDLQELPAFAILGWVRFLWIDATLNWSQSSLAPSLTRRPGLSFSAAHLHSCTESEGWFVFDERGMKWVFSSADYILDLLDAKNALTEKTMNKRWLASCQRASERKKKSDWLNQVKHSWSWISAVTVARVFVVPGCSSASQVRFCLSVGSLVVLVALSSSIWTGWLWSAWGNRRLSTNSCWGSEYLTPYVQQNHNTFTDGPSVFFASLKETFDLLGNALVALLTES